MTDNPWYAEAIRRVGRPNKETRPEKAYRMACLHLRVEFEEQIRAGKYRPDFYHRQWNLIVEVDGPTHYRPLGKAKDRTRDAALKKMGYRILHIKWTDVVSDPFIIVERIVQENS